MAKFIDKDGNPQEVSLNGMALYKEAMAKKVTVRQLINSKCPTAAGGPDAFQQMCVEAGLRFKADDSNGVPATNLLDMFEGPAASSFTQADAIPTSRLLFPAALMEVIEDALQSKEDVATGAFESLVGYRSTVVGNRIEQPVISYNTTKGPQDSQFQHISQNTRPPILLSLVSSDISRKIPTTSIGMEISREALQANNLDFVAMTLTRFLRHANYNEWVAQITALLSGDADAANTTMSNGTAALPVVKASAYDTSIVADGVLSQKAWLKYLYAHSMMMTKTHLVCDFDAALALDTRLDRPTNVHNDSTDRLDVPFTVQYPAFGKNVSLLVMPTGTFAANTIMGLEQPTAISKITSSTASYSAIEEIVMKKSTEIRLDRGFITYRNYTDSFDVLSLIA
ncbi:hypothetical protein GW915_14205 [bacterium]|nr:hypothetical protein [bacterium]